MQSLWGEEFEIQDTKEKTKKALKQLQDVSMMSEDDIKKYVRSKNVSIQDKLDAINKYVSRVLHEHIDTTRIIKNKIELVLYFDKIIQDGELAYDTETTNSLDPYTGKILGLCLFSVSNLPAYVPINHTDLNGNRLSWQLTEEDCREQLQRLKDHNIKIIMHNGGFDYKFTKKSLGIELPIYWDTMVGCRLIDENDISAALKWQYHYKIDPNHPIYDIDSMFPGIPYAIVDPNIFALYSATDSLMTYKLYKYQYEILTREDELGVYNLFKDVEMPLIIPVAEMELDGIKFDKEYCERLDNKYSKILSEYDDKLKEILDEISPQIIEWRQTKDANEKPKVYGKGTIPTKAYPLKDKQGIYKLGKSKNETLEEIINLESPAQLSILLYDILKYEPYDDKNPRSTDKAALSYFSEKGSILCENILGRRQVLTLLDDFITKLPKLVNPVTGKIHCNFNQLGKEDKGVVTGRFSSSEPNLQQIPSKNTEIRLLFCGDTIYNDVELEKDYFVVSNVCEIETTNGWKYAIDLLPGDELIDNDGSIDVVINSKINGNNVYIYI